MTALHPPGRRAAALTGVLLVALLAVACAAPSGSVRTPVDGRGRIPGAAVAPSTGCDRPTQPVPPPGRSTLLVPVGGGTRFSLVDVPAGAGPHPLLVSLHPFLLGPEQWDDYSGLSAAATARGYVVVTPLGSDPGPRWAVPGGVPSGADDIGFVGALADHVEDALCIDRNREFAAGFSAGAAMAQALSCTMPWRFAGVAGSGGTNLTSLCPDAPGTDVLVLHGTADPIAPPSGSTVAFAPPLGLDVRDVVATDAARAGCAPAPVTTHPTASTVQQDFTGCAEGRRVRYLSLIGAGHTWAGAPNPLIELVGGPTATDVSATAVALDFFDATATP